ALNPDRTVEQYLEDVRAGKEWGDNLEIAVLMQVFNRPIIVIDDHAQIRKGLNHEGYKGEPIFVHYNGHNHYNAYLLEDTWHTRTSEILASLLKNNATSLVKSAAEETKMEAST